MEYLEANWPGLILDQYFWAVRTAFVTTQVPKTAHTYRKKGFKKFAGQFWDNFTLKNVIGPQNSFTAPIQSLSEPIRVPG